MISVIDKTSGIRRVCFELLTAAGQDVMVFHSPETFVNSGAIYRSDLLILGQTRVRAQQCDTLQWAGMLRPDLRTFLLHPKCFELARIPQVCRQPHMALSVHTPARCLEILRKALASGILLGRRGQIFDRPGQEMMRNAA